MPCNILTLSHHLNIENITSFKRHFRSTDHAEPCNANDTSLRLLSNQLTLLFLQAEVYSHPRVTKGFIYVQTLKGPADSCKQVLLEAFAEQFQFSFTVGYKKPARMMQPSHNTQIHVSANDKTQCASNMHVHRVSCRI
jgi:hypothetical protein